MPAIPAPTTHTSESILLSNTGRAGSFDVADQSDTPSLEMEKLSDTDLTTRRREGACSIVFSPNVQLPSTATNNGRTMSHSAAGNSQNPDMAIPRNLYSPAFTCKT